MGFEIYFSELDKETQEALLEYFGIRNAEEMNWDVFPIAIIERGEE